MWRLSDKILLKFEKELERRKEKVEKIVDELNLEWLEFEEARGDIEVYGVDGSRGIERRSGVIVYVISSVAVGSELYRINELSFMKPYRHVEDRVRMHMLMSEYRAGSAVDADVVLMDGTLSGAIIRPPAYINEKSYAALSKFYNLDAVIEDFTEVLEGWWKEIIEDVREDRVREEYLLSRSEYFDGIERGCRIKDGGKEDLMIFLEYVEYLHSLNKLLENQKVIFIAKTHYTTHISKSYEIPDSAVLDYFCVKRFGFEKAGYMLFRQPVEKTPPLANLFSSISDMRFNGIYSAFVRFADGKSIYLAESNEPIDVLSELKNMEYDGYPLPLIHAHRHAEISRKDMKRMIASLTSAIKVNKYGFMLKGGREAIE